MVRQANRSINLIYPELARQVHLTLDRLYSRYPPTQANVERAILEIFESYKGEDDAEETK